MVGLAVGDFSLVEEGLGEPPWPPNFSSVGSSVGLCEGCKLMGVGLRVSVWSFKARFALFLALFLALLFELTTTGSTDVGSVAVGVVTTVVGEVTGTTELVGVAVG